MSPHGWSLPLVRVAQPSAAPSAWRGPWVDHVGSAVVRQGVQLGGTPVTSALQRRAQQHWDTSPGTLAELEYLLFSFLQSRPLLRGEEEGWRGIMDAVSFLLPQRRTSDPHEY